MSDYKKLFFESSVDKQLIISFDEGVIDNTDVSSESMEVAESICSGESLQFGFCAASSFKVKIFNTGLRLKGKKIQVSILCQGAEEPYVLGTYKVESDELTDDRWQREIIAYDSMYDILKKDVTAWYNSLIFPMTLKKFRDSFFKYVGVEQESKILANDNMVIEKTISPSELYGKMVINAICELGGSFGHIKRDGRFGYVVLQEIVSGLYPANDLHPNKNLFPRDTNTENISEYYCNCTYQDYKVQKISRLLIRQQEGDIGAAYPDIGDANNCYVIQDNFLVYGKGNAELKQIAQNVFAVISNVCYTPFKAESAGNPCIEVGEAVRFNSGEQVIYSYVLSRTLKGTQGLVDNYEAKGKEYYTTKGNSLRYEVKQLKGKTNILARTVEETRLEIKDIEKGLASRITQTAEAIETEVIRATAVEENLSSKISQTAESISTEVTRAQNAENALSSRIVQTAETISAEVERATAEEGKLSADLKLTAESISAEVTRAQNAENALSSRIVQTAEAIELKVSKGEVSSQLSVESGQITIKSNRFVLEATNCSISKEGNISAKNVDLAGKIKATSGEIGGFTINSTNLYNAKSALFSSTSGVYIGTDGIAVGPGSTAVGSAAFAVTRDGKIYLGYNSNIQSKGDIIFENTCVIKYGTTGTNHIRFGPDGIVIGGYGGKLGFFSSANAGSTKKTVSNLTTAASSDTVLVAAKLNDLLTALRAYGLIG